MQQWEYTFVEFECINDTERKARRINDNVVDDWENGLAMPEFFNRMGEQGWDIVPPSSLDSVAFKRPKS